MECPKCGFSQPDSNIECDRCGVIFAKLGIRVGAASVRPAQAVPVPPGIDSDVESVDRQAPRSQRRGSSPTEELPTSNIRTNPQVAVSPLPGPPYRREPVRPAENDDIVVEDLDPVPAYTEDTEAFVPELRHMESADWTVLGAGVVLAVVIMFFPLLKHIFSTFTILVHEMGHSIAGWVFGYPSFPAFDFCYGGGVTLHIDRSSSLVILFYVLAAAVIYLYRTNALTVLTLSVVVAIHIVVSVTSAHQALILFMGHGTELVIAAIFFYRALSGAAVIHSAERPLYCLIACFIVFSDVGFAYRLWTSAEEREIYGEAKGGGHWMDFSQLADDHFHTSLSAVACFFLVCCLLTLVVGFLMFRYQEYLRYAIEKLFSRQSSTNWNGLSKG